MTNIRKQKRPTDDNQPLNRTHKIDTPAHFGETRPKKMYNMR